MIELSEEIKVFLIAMTPIAGLRISIPLALTVYGINSFLAYLISILGATFSVFLILNFLGISSKWLSKHFYFFNRFFAFLFSRTRKKHSAQVKKYGLYALAAFVSIPLPATGGWTGSLIAFVFNLPIKKAFISITIGNLIAGGIILFITYTGITIKNYFGWQVLAGIVFVGGVGYFLYKKFINGRNNRY